MFRKFTCPSSGVLIYRLFTAACGVMPCEKTPHAAVNNLYIRTPEDGHVNVRNM